jgi:hypothetical protein
VHLNLVRNDRTITTGPVIFAYFEPGSVGIVFQGREDGPALGGRADPELIELYWFTLVDGRLELPALGTIQRWEIVA